MHPDDLLQIILAEIETFADLSDELLDSNVWYVKEMATVGVPYRPAVWLNRRPLPRDRRQSISRVARRLERHGLVQRITEAKRDRVTHLRPTPAGLWRALALAGAKSDHQAVIRGLRLIYWAGSLAAEIERSIKTSA